MCGQTDLNLHNFQGHSQTSEQDKASFERQRRELLGGLGACPPENFEIEGLRNAFVSILRGIFLQKSQSWASAEVHFFIA